MVPDICPNIYDGGDDMCYNTVTHRYATGENRETPGKQETRKLGKIVCSV
jgi:hypothetical protein